MKPSLKFDTILTFRDDKRCEARCRMRLFALGSEAIQALVIFTEMPSNPGMPITKAIEMIASQAVQKYDLDPDGTLWVEHYPGSLRSRKSKEYPPSDYVYVNFSSYYFDQEGFHYKRPNWQPTSLEELENIVGESLEFE